MPAVSGFIDDETWGKEGGHRRVITNGNFFVRKGVQGYDEILVRKENEYWKWQVSDFSSRSLFFAKKAVGEYTVVSKKGNKTEVKWKYSWYSRSRFHQPVTYLFVKLFWSGIMKSGMKKMKRFAESDEEFKYE